MIAPAAEFERSLLNLIRRSVSILHWASTPGGHSNGSMFFIDIGAGIFGVTAKHVYEAYQLSIARNSTLCKIDGMPFDPTSRIVSAGVMCDVATFRVTEEELRTLDRLTTPWPPVVPEVGQKVLLAGFPGCEKSFQKPNSVGGRMYAAKWTVHGVNDQDISIIRPPDNEVYDVFASGFPERQYDFGGMSGGPIAVVVDRASILSWALSGVIYECHQTFEILKAVRADFIGADGVVTV